MQYVQYVHDGHPDPPEDPKTAKMRLGVRALSEVWVHLHTQEFKGGNFSAKLMQVSCRSSDQFFLS